MWSGDSSDDMDAMRASFSAVTRRLQAPSPPPHRHAVRAPALAAIANVPDFFGPRHDQLHAAGWAAFPARPAQSPAHLPQPEARWPISERHGYDEGAMPGHILHSADMAAAASAGDRGESDDEQLADRFAETLRRIRAAAGAGVAPPHARPLTTASPGPSSSPSPPAAPAASMAPLGSPAAYHTYTQISGHGGLPAAPLAWSPGRRHSPAGDGTAGGSPAGGASLAARAARGRLEAAAHASDWPSPSPPAQRSRSAAGGGLLLGAYGGGGGGGGGQPAAVHAAQLPLR
jgi:hypothetical protein